MACQPPPQIPKWYNNKEVSTKLSIPLSSSGYQDSNLGPSAPKADALTGLRYTPNIFATAKVRKKMLSANFSVQIFDLFFVGRSAALARAGTFFVRNWRFYLEIKKIVFIFVEQ